MGCEVVAAGSSPEKLDALKAWGADHVIGYEDFEKTIYGIYGKPHRRKFEGGVDVVINFTGGDTWVPSLKATQRGGKILTCGATAGFDQRKICATYGRSNFRFWAPIPGRSKISKP